MTPFSRLTPDTYYTVNSLWTNRINRLPYSSIWGCPFFHLFRVKPTVHRKSPEAHMDQDSELWCTSCPNNPNMRGTLGPQMSTSSRPTSMLRAEKPKDNWAETVLFPTPPLPAENTKSNVATWRSWPSDKDNMGCEWASSTWTKSHHSKVLFRLVLLSWSHWAGRLNHCHFAAFGPYVTWKFQHHQLTFFEIFENIPQPTNPWILSMGASPPTPTIPTPPDRTKIFLFTLDNRSCTSANAGSFFLASPDAQRDWLGQPAHEELFPACSPWVSAACFFLCFL